MRSSTSVFAPLGFHLHLSTMTNVLAVLLLALTSSCSALVVGVTPTSQLSAASVSPRSLTPVMKRSAEERDMLEMEGVVTESMRGANFRVVLDETEQVNMLPATARSPRSVQADGICSLMRPTDDHGDHLWQDPQELHQGARGRQGDVRDLALRPHQGAHHLPQEISGESPADAFQGLMGGRCASRPTWAT